MCDNDEASRLWEYGLIGCFDTIVMMHGDRIAIITSDNGNQELESISDKQSADEVENDTFDPATDVWEEDECHLASSATEANNVNADDTDNSPCSGDAIEEIDEEYEDCTNDTESSINCNGLSYIELQCNSKILAIQLRLRFGVKINDLVLVACGGHTAAEVVAMLACLRLGAAFVPVDDAWLHGGAGRLEGIVSNVCALHLVY